MSITDRANIIYDTVLLENRIVYDKYDIDTTQVMREETGLILNKQRTLFNILTVSTLVTLIITFSI